MYGVGYAWFTIERQAIKKLGINMGDILLEFRKVCRELL
jgi:hypothetical protein